MKKFISLLLLPLLFAACIKNETKEYKSGPQVEFDATVLNSPALNKTFPILTRVPEYGKAVVTTNPAITRSSGTVKFRVNLIGKQFSTDQTINVRVVDSETTAVANTHYSTTGTIVIPANSSFGELTVNIINPGVASATPRVVVFELVGNDQIQPAANYRFLGISISQA